MSARKQSSQELTKVKILQTARSLFIEKGFQEVSMREIAKQLGCSHGALYYHFTNKADLFYEIVATDFSKLNTLLDEIVNSSDDDSTKLFRIFLEYIAFGLNHQSQYEIMFIIRNTEVDGLSQKAATTCYQKFAQSVYTLSKKKLGAADVWSAFLSLHGYVSQYRGYVNSFKEIEQGAKLHVKFILKALNN